MKKYLFALIMCLPFLTGCAGCRNGMKHMQSAWVGLERKVTLYGADGREIRTWRVKAQVEDAGGTCYFLTDNNKAVTVAGTFVIEEL